MKSLVLLFICIFVVLAKAQDDHELDWWQHGVFYQVIKNIAN
jgi:hypothetical protein